ncbi:MAG: XdhC family protein [Acidimicrobiia bacterium]
MDVLRLAAELRDRGEPFALATVTWRQGPSSGKAGSRAIIRPDGSVTGWIGGACARPTVVREALASLVDGTARLLALGVAETRPDVIGVPMACASEGAMEVYVEPFLPAPDLHIVGSSPMTETLSALAETLGWRVTRTEDADFAGLSEASMIVVATQGDFDEPALEAALATPARYVGLVASAKRAAGVVEWLRSRGVSDDALARLRSPAGLDLGSTEHDEIAVAILAELVALRATGGFKEVVEVTQPETAVDPVCEMTVDVATARFRTEYEGTTYYFCAAGCQRAFEADPENFA